MSASAGPVQAAVIGAVLAFGGLAFARLGWAGLRRRIPDPAPGRELAPAPPMSAPAWKIAWAFSLAFGAFVFVCGLLLLLSLFLPE